MRKEIIIINAKLAPWKYTFMLSFFSDIIWLFSPLIMYIHIFTCINAQWIYQSRIHGRISRPFWNYISTFFRKLFCLKVRQRKMLTTNIWKCMHAYNMELQRKIEFRLKQVLTWEKWTTDDQTCRRTLTEKELSVYLRTIYFRGIFPILDEMSSNIVSPIPPLPLRLKRIYYVCSAARKLQFKIWLFFLPHSLP